MTTMFLFLWGYLVTGLGIVLIFHSTIGRELFDDLNMLPSQLTGLSVGLALLWPLLVVAAAFDWWDQR